MKSIYFWVGTTSQQIISDSIKNNGTDALLTTGASDANKVLNIYDFTGNVFTYTLGNYQNGDSSSSIYGVIRGGNYNNDGSYMAASWNSWGEMNGKIGFRNCLY